MKMIRVGESYINVEHISAVVKDVFEGGAKIIMMNGKVITSKLEPEEIHHKIKYAEGW